LLYIFLIVPVTHCWRTGTKLITKKYWKKLDKKTRKRNKKKNLDLYICELLYQLSEYLFLPNLYLCFWLCLPLKAMQECCINRYLNSPESNNSFGNYRGYCYYIYIDWSKLVRILDNLRSVVTERKWKNQWIRKGGTKLVTYILNCTKQKESTTCWR